MTPDDRTHTHPQNAARDPADAALDAGLAAAFGGDTTRLCPTPTDPDAGTALAGKYRLSEKIGEGGMGSVWVAHQTEPVKRKVAVKLIKAGMDSKQVLARFEAERQALAVMDHPSIAKVLDGGLHDGRPYFVMELVKGVPITEYCDARKLTPKERLELFVPVCQALQHAHQKGVIHRDVKPSNVLVALYDGKPVPKVIDFGVAKATGGQLTDRTLETGFGAVVGTPAYMSPEQASLNNLDVDTRSDVYALGVLLYELLTGSPPFSKRELEQKGLLEMLRVVREEEPPRPSHKLSTADTLPGIAAVRGIEPKALTGLLRNELDWIVMKALEKERGRRYETANGFAADVLRFLSGEPVQAHPPSAGYRLRKLVRRHRGPVIAAAVVTAAVLLGFAGTTGGMVWALGAERQAKSDRDAAVKAQGEADDERTRANTEAVNAKDARERQLADQLLADMQLLPTLYEKGSAADVSAILARHNPKPGDPDRRRFEWNYWNRQLNGERSSVQLAGDFASGSRRAVFNDDGSKLAVVSSAPTPVGDTLTFTVRVVDAATGREVFSKSREVTPQQKDMSIQILPPRFSPDGKRLVVAGGFPPRQPDPQPHAETVVTGFEVDSGNKLFEFPLAGTKVGVRIEISRDGHVLIFDATSVLGVWDCTTGKPIPFTPPDDGSLIVGPTPDGRSLLAMDDLPVPPLQSLAGSAVGVPSITRVKFGDLPTGAVRHECYIPTDRAIWSPTFTFIGDGSLLAGLVHDDPSLLIPPLPDRPREPHQLVVWDTTSGKCLGSLALPKYATSGLAIVAAASGSRLAVVPRLPGFMPGSPQPADDDSVQIVDASTVKTLTTLRGAVGGQPKAQSAFFSPDGEKFALQAGDSIRVWNPSTGELLRVIRSQVPVIAARFDPTGQLLRTVDEKGVLKEWEVLTPERRTPLPTTPATAPVILRDRDQYCFSPDGGRFWHLGSATKKKTLHLETTVYDAQVKPILTLSLQRDLPDEYSSPTTQAALCRDGNRAVLLYHSPRTYASSPAPKPGEPYVPPEPLPRENPELFVWETETKKELVHLSVGGRLGKNPFWKGEYTPSVNLAVSPDGTWVVVGNWPKQTDSQSCLRVFHAATGAERPPLEIPGHVQVHKIAFSPTGSRVAAVVALATPARPLTQNLAVWDVESGRLVRSIEIAPPGALRWYDELNPLILEWAADGTKLAYFDTESSKTRGVVVEADSGKVLAELDFPTVQPGELAERVLAASFHPDGTRLAAVGSGKTVRVWDTESGKTVLILPVNVKADQESSIGAHLRFSSDGRQLHLTERRQPVGRALLTPTPTGSRKLPSLVFTTWDASPPPEAKK